MRFEHGHRLGAVAVLRAVVLALHDDPRRDVRDAHRRVGFVDVLAAGARRAVGVDAQVGRVDVDLERIVDLGVDEDRAETGVAARVRVERRFPDQPVDSGFRAQHAEAVVARELDRRRLDSGDVAFGFFHDVDGVTLAFAVFHVHAQQHGRPVLRLGAASARLNVDKAVEWISRIVEHAAEFEVGNLLFDNRDIIGDRIQRIVVVLLACHRK